MSRIHPGSGCRLPPVEREARAPALARRETVRFDVLCGRVVRATRVEVTAESMPPDTPTTNPSVPAFCE